MFSISFLFMTSVLASQPQAPKSVQANKWIFNESKSAFDDSTTIVVSLDAENVVQGFLQTTRPTLILRCRENRTDAYINVGMAANPEYGSDNFSVRLRFDSQTARREQWSESTSRDALFSRAPIEIARALSQAQTFLFEFTPFDASPAVVRFDVRGLDIAKLETTCHWKEYEARRDAQRRLGLLELGTPVMARGLKVPVPSIARSEKIYTINGKDLIDVFAPSRKEDLMQFYNAALQMQGWRNSTGGCWLAISPQSKKDERLCVDFSDPNWVHIKIGVEIASSTKRPSLTPETNGFVLERPVGMPLTVIPKIEGARYNHTKSAILDLTHQLGSSDVVTVGGMDSTPFVEAFTQKLADSGWIQDDEKCWTKTTETLTDRLCIDSSLPFLTVLTITPVAKQ
jgi:hypothetical protein